MKYSIFITLFFILPFCSFGQSKIDYSNAMSQFQNYYNRHQTDSICYICENPRATNNKPVVTQQTLETLMNELGELKSYQYMDNNDYSNGVIVFKTNFAKSTQFMGISLNKDKKIVSFSIQPELPQIDTVKKK